MKKLFLITTFFFITSTVLGQQKNNDQYQLYKGGKKYPKLQRYVLLNKGDKKDKDPISNISFIIEGEIFKYIANNHNRDTISVSKLHDINFSTIKELKIAEYQEHKKRTKEAGIKIPPPLNHYNIKVYILEKICGEKAIKYEVDWIYTIQ